METAYLHEFAKVADCGSFTAAARELHLTQSTLSKHVALLEREFGADLFVRDRSGVSLTEAGGVLYAQARQMEKLLRATELLVRAARDGQGSAGAGVAGATAGAAAGGGAVDGSPAAACDTALRCKCRLAAERCGLDRRELGALILYVEERGFETIQGELALTRDEVADVLGSVYRKLGVGDKQEALDFIHSVSE